MSKSKKTHRQSLITTYRVMSILLLVAILATNLIQIYRPPQIAETADESEEVSLAIKDIAYEMAPVEVRDGRNIGTIANVKIVGRTQRGLKVQSVDGEIGIRCFSRVQVVPDNRGLELQWNFNVKLRGEDNEAEMPYFKYGRAVEEDLRDYLKNEPNSFVPQYCSIDELIQSGQRVAISYGISSADGLILYSVALDARDQYLAWADNDDSVIWGTIIDSVLGNTIDGAPFPVSGAEVAEKLDFSIAEADVLYFYVHGNGERIELDDAFKE